jgi:glycosyltransferase involved in cell wall biosynthesis
MDIFVLTSLQETLGFPALEALAYCKAVVAFGVGGIYSFLRDGETGLVVNVKDTEGLVRAIVRLIEDPDLRVKLGRQGRALVEEKFSMASIVERLLVHYRKAISETQGGRVG